MTYPSILEYDAALSDVANSLQVKQFRSAVPQRHPNNHRFIAYTGGYSRVYKLNLVRDDYALKCWTADVPDAGVRYPQIAAYLVKTKLPYFIDFGYEPEGILVGKTLYPTLWMKWVSGRTLCPFVDKYIDQPDILLATARAFRQMVAKLHAAHIAHGDLQDGNIIADVQGGWVDLTLIDYDSMAVPALFGLPASISGQSNYQSPYRDNLPDMSERQDYFSELVIYLSLRAYAEKPALWMAEQDKQLLFEAADFVTPGKTAVWQKLDGLSPAVRYLADRLRAFSVMSDLNALQPLEEVLAGYTPANQPALPAKPMISPSWDDFTSELLATQPDAVVPASAKAVVNEDWLVETFEKLPERAPATRPVQQAAQVSVPTPVAVDLPAQERSNAGLVLVMLISGVFSVFSFLIPLSANYWVSLLIFGISAGIFVLTILVALRRMINAATRGPNP